MTINANIFEHGLKDTSPELKAIINKQKTLFECGVNFWQNLAEHGFSQEKLDHYVNECANTEIERGKIQKGYSPSTALYFYSIFAPQNTKNALSFDKIYARNVHIFNDLISNHARDFDNESGYHYFSGLSDSITYLDEQQGYSNTKLFDAYNSALRIVMVNTGYVKKDKYTINDITSLNNTLSIFGDEDNNLKGCISRFIIALNIFAGDSVDKTRHKLSKFVDNNFVIAKKYNLDVALDDMKYSHFIKRLVSIDPDLNILDIWKTSLNLWHDVHVLEHIDKHKDIILARDPAPLLDYIYKAKNEMKNGGLDRSKANDALDNGSSEAAPRLKMN